MTGIAAIVPVGDLSLFGYERVATVCIGSMATVFDTVYLVSSSRNDATARRIAGQHDNAMLVSEPHTWFARTPEGAEWFDAYRVMENADLGLGLATAGGHDVAVCMMCNWYVPEWSDFRAWCEAACENGRPWAWLYRMDQLGDVFFHASVRLPFIVNLSAPVEMRLSTDCLVVDDQIIGMERGDMGHCDEIAVVDVQLEVTRQELRDKLDFIRCYHDLVPKRKALFEWPYWFTYYTEKYRAKRMAFAQQNAISALSQEDFVSQMVLGAL